MCSDRFYLCVLAPVKRARNDLSFISSRDGESERDRPAETERHKERQSGK